MVRLIVFAKAPIAGCVKTRLCPPLTPQAAARLHERMVRHTLEQACDAAPGCVELHCSPATPDPFLADCAGRHRAALRYQAEGDIGARMAHALRAALRGAPAVLIGTDCPARSADDLRTAIRMLDEGCDAVIGPVDDGGYSLIGLARFDASVFADIDWSTPRVTAQTEDRFRHLGWRWHRLPVSWDVDRPADLERLRASHPAMLANLTRDVAASA